MLDAGPPYKLGERVSRLTPIAQEGVERVLAGLNLGVQPGLDPDPSNVVAVGTFGFTPPNSAPQQVGAQELAQYRKTFLVQRIRALLELDFDLTAVGEGHFLLRAACCNVAS